MALCQLAYVSDSDGVSAPEDISALLACARRNNVRDDITGVLLVSRCGFVQAIEGPRIPVMALFARLEDDHRHRNLVLLHKGDAHLRAFPDSPMSMHLADGDSLRRLERSMPCLGAGLRCMLTAEIAGTV